MRAAAGKGSSAAVTGKGKRIDMLGPSAVGPHVAEPTRSGRPFRSVSRAPTRGLVSGRHVPRRRREANCRNHRFPTSTAYRTPIQVDWEHCGFTE